MEDLEKTLLLKALDRTKGIKKRAAELLHINFRSMRYRLEKYGLNQEEDSPIRDRVDKWYGGLFPFELFIQFIQRKVKKDRPPMRTGGRQIERIEAFHQFLHFFSPQDEISS